MPLPARVDRGFVDPDTVVLPARTGAYRLTLRTCATTCLGFGDESNLGSQCQLRTCPVRPCATPVTAGATLLGWTTHVAFVLRKCLCNAHNALCMRHGARQPVVTRDVGEVFCVFARALSGLDAEYIFHPMRSHGTWLLKWPESRRREFIRSEAREDLTPESVKAMVKREVNHSRPTKARLIQFYKTLCTQSFCGPYFYALQKVVSHLLRNYPLDENVDLTFASGMRASEIAAWMQKAVDGGARWFYERDGKNWDSSMQAQHSAFRIRIYALFDHELAKFAQKCLRVRGFAAFPGGVLRYVMEHTVKSGHNDTTIGNSLINAAIAYAALKRAHVRASIIVAGDDLLVASYDPISCNEIMSFEREYGITPEARVFENPWEVTFISGMWVNDGSQFAFVPMIGRLFARLWWTVKPPSRREHNRYLRGVARGLAPAIGTLPLARLLVDKFDSPGEAGRSDKGYVYRGTEYVLKERVLEDLSRRYGCSPQEILACESWLRRLPSEPLLIVHPVLDRIAAVDLADIGNRGKGIWPPPPVGPR
jgi:hypothetical protein